MLATLNNRGTENTSTKFLTFSLLRAFPYFNSNVVMSHAGQGLIPFTLLIFSWAFLLFASTGFQTAGSGTTSIRIRPSLIFQPKHAIMFLEGFQTVLHDMSHWVFLWIISFIVWCCLTIMKCAVVHNPRHLCVFVLLGVYIMCMNCFIVFDQGKIITWVLNARAIQNRPAARCTLVVSHRLLPTPTTLLITHLHQLHRYLIQRMTY